MAKIPRRLTSPHKVWVSATARLLGYKVCKRENHDNGWGLIWAVVDDKNSEVDLFYSEDQARMLYSLRNRGTFEITP